MLAGADDLVAANIVQRMCAKAGKGRVMCLPNGQHGAVLLNASWQARVLNEVAAFLERA